ncbi:energy-coupling factor ABC transporter ATP-binding protein [Natronincola ferrireducens]|uniref:Energy-coupling factor transport system ATP-binding protein n=1 Tax=Natronincola ferrireducens TaxID=393762 RepID=A0A1G8ZR12_9FIRM|nr:ABC transporter ATP-binding protein [Natronincola ferrireducens]SDK16610.1 energy-coupling factor transport system ATP-binding protein [Natronincola ferrireducens]
MVILYYIELENVEFGYEKNKDIIKNTSLQMFQQDFTAIIGPNGGGKTTIGKLMAGILKPSKGRVMIDGVDSRDMKLGGIGQKIGYLFQNPERQIFAPTVEEDLTFPLGLKGIDKQKAEKKAEEMMETFHLSHLRGAFPFTLSQGEKQRLALAGVFMNDPSFVILDEPTTGLDPERRKILSNILEELHKKSIGITIISHDEDFIHQHATRIIEIVGGKVLADTRKKARS